MVVQIKTVKVSPGEANTTHVANAARLSQSYLNETMAEASAGGSSDDDSRCLLLALSHDELGVMFDGLADRSSSP